MKQKTDEKRMRTNIGETSENTLFITMLRLLIYLDKI